MISTTLSTPLAAILADADQVPLTLGREAATELGLVALEYLEGTPSERDVRSLVRYAARHDEAAPARDALVGVLLNASGTLDAGLAQRAREEIMRADWGGGRETPALTTNPEVSAVPRRQALTERLMAERARRLRPRMHAVVVAILAQGAEAPAIPTWFLERNWIDLRDALVQRVRIEPMHRESIARWVAAQPPAVRDRLHAVEDALVDVVTQAILHTPERAPLAPYFGDERVAEGVRSAVTFRGAPARARLGNYLARLSPGTAWYETIREMTVPPPKPWAL
ncbi:MAG: hypothetical protein JWN79_2396 [Gemmatimonadetes bacterium]|jgi:hypothetical protein|nr:hypothetical protein [Gemmatimonadota bacterium]